MPQGQGNTLGAALNSLLAAFGVQPKGRLTSYKDKTWHAQLVHLTQTHRGYTALEEAGLHITHATLMKWLADDEYNVRRSCRETIAQAYEAAATIPAGPIPQAFKDHQFEIRGIVKTGADQRNRGAGGSAPLRIDGRNGHWPPSRPSGARENSTTASSRTTSSTSSSATISAKAPTAGTSPAAPTPSPDPLMDRVVDPDEVAVVLARRTTGWTSAGLEVDRATGRDRGCITRRSAVLQGAREVSPEAVAGAPPRPAP